jgi:formate hydrogenlyase subunit 6/NADH:ubiquinone oxidoreductase subunit I
VRDCPAAALELRRKGRDEFILLYYPDRCAYCGQCELSCQFGAIYLSHTFTSATVDRDTLVTVLGNGARPRFQRQNLPPP